MYIENIVIGYSKNGSIKNEDIDLLFPAESFREFLIRSSEGKQMIFKNDGNST